MNSEKQISKVVKVFSDYILIEKLNIHAPKDFYGKKEKFISPEDFTKVKVGDLVEFIPNVVEDKYFANDIILRQIENPSHNDDKDLITIKLESQDVKQKDEGADLVSGFIFTLKQKAKNAKWKEFEDLTLFILKALGASEIYPIPPNDNRGQCDGICKFSGIATNTPKLEVFYDCTLEDNWRNSKEKQIDNYTGQIVKTQLTITYRFMSPGFEKEIKQQASFNNSSDKQIWIVTRNKTQIIENRQHDNVAISIKEISIFDLIDILKKKFQDTSFNTIDSVTDSLKSLGNP